MMNKKKIIYDEDGDTFFFGAMPGKVAEGMKDWYEYLCSRDIDMIDYSCISCDVTTLTCVPSAERLGVRWKSYEQSYQWQVLSNAQEMMASGTDGLHMACEAAHRNGKTIIGQMRMNDAHHVNNMTRDVSEYLCPQYIIDHPELRIVNETDNKKIYLPDYSFKEVRDLKLRELTEIAGNYDVDGLDLDWMRWCQFFAMSKQRENAHILTQFVRDVRKMLDEEGKRKGRRLVLHHKVASTLDESLGIGLDIAAWLKEGLADALQPMDFLFTDYNLRTDEFAEICKGTGCAVYPVIHDSLGGTKDITGRDAAPFDENRCRAAVANMYSWGADGIVMFNYTNFGNGFFKKDRFEKYISIMSSPEGAAGHRQYLYIPTWKWRGGLSPTGRTNAQTVQFRSDEIGERKVFYFRMADGRRGEKLNGKISIYINEVSMPDIFRFDINGKTIPEKDIVLKYVNPVGDDGLLSSGIRYEVSLADCPPFKGDNELGMTWIEKNWLVSNDPFMEILRVDVDQ
jgi:hypothetical protein